MGELEGKVAVITGGASGIGARTVRLFTERGARVVIADLQEARGEALAAELGDAACFVRTDVSREPEMKNAVETALGRFGRLDVLFNNAGFGGVLGSLEGIPVEEWDLTFDVLVRSVYLGIKHASPILRKQASGSIINTASIAGMEAGWGPHAYSAAKAAVLSLTQSVAKELAPEGIRVNAISPGYIATPLAANTVGQPDEAIDPHRERMASLQPIPRAGEAEDVAQAALFLASDASAFVTGQNIVVDGGLTGGRVWKDQPGFFKKYRPITVYRPETER